MIKDDDWVSCDECLYNGGIDCESPQLHHWGDETICGIRTIDNELIKIEDLKLKMEA